MIISKEGRGSLRPQPLESLSALINYGSNLFWCPMEMKKEEKRKEKREKREPRLRTNY
jgi:hypothetical protein